MSTESSAQRFSLATLTAMVVGSMVGAGVFSLPRNFGTATGPFGALIAWAIAGGGMLALAFVFQTLSRRKPDIDAGVYAYAKAGFGNYLGFLSALGYWASACVGNTSYWVLIKSTLGAFVPAFGDGNTLTAVAVSSIALWAFHFLILRGVKEAAFINQIVTWAKVVPLLLFVALAAVSFDSGLFAANFWGGEGAYGDLAGQVRATMLVTVFVFLGVEGASVYSRFARDRNDVGRATVLGFIGVLILFVLVTLLSYGIMAPQQLAGLRQPSVGGVLESIVGPWGAVFIGAGLIVSVLGAYLSWTLLAAEVLFTAAKTHDMPAFLATENANGVPSTALLLSTSLVQIFLVVTMFSQDAFLFALKLCSSLSLVPYLLVAAYALKLVRQGETYDVDPKDRQRDLIIALVATVYTVFMIYAGGLKFLLLGFVIYAPFTALFFRARRERTQPVFVGLETTLFIISIIGAVVGIVGLATGLIAI